MAATEMVEGRSVDSAPVGRRLSATTTRLDARVTICMEPLPTAIYHLLDPSEEPFLRVEVSNTGQDSRRVIIRAQLQGLSAESAATVGLGPPGSKKMASKQVVHLSPTLLPGSMQYLNSAQRATLTVTIEEIGKNIESLDT
jgi:hypothetical protein